MARYKSVHTGPQIDSEVARALSGGAIDAALESKMEVEFLDNTDFTTPVAQAEIGGLHGSVPYAADRWKLISGTVSWDSNGLTLNGTIRQIREHSIGFPVVPSIEMHSGTATITYDDTTKYCDITSSGGTIKRPHLGLRAITDWAKIPAVDYGEELRKCQRYCMAYGQYAQWGAVNFHTNFIDLTIPTPCNMRATPTIINSENIALISNEAVQPGFTFSVAVMKGNNIRLRATKTSHGLTGAFVEFFGLVLFSADL